MKAESNKVCKYFVHVFHHNIFCKILLKTIVSKCASCLERTDESLSKAMCQMEARPLACARHHTRGHCYRRRWFTATGAILRWTSKCDILYTSLPSLTVSIDITVALDQGTVEHDVLWLNIWSALDSSSAVGMPPPLAYDTAESCVALLICPTSVAMHYSCCPLELGVEAPPSKPRRTFRDIGLAGLRRGIWPQEDLVCIGIFRHACVFSLLTCWIRRDTTRPAHNHFIEDC